GEALHEGFGLEPGLVELDGELGVVVAQVRGVRGVRGAGAHAWRPPVQADLVAEAIGELDEVVDALAEGLEQGDGFVGGHGNAPGGPRYPRSGIASPDRSGDAGIVGFFFRRRGAWRGGSRGDPGAHA